MSDKRTTMVDMTGQPYSDEELQEAIRVVEELMTKHAAILPLFTVHSGAIRSFLKELQQLRLERGKAIHAFLSPLLSRSDRLEPDAAVASPGKTVVVNCKTDEYDVMIDRTTIFGNSYHESQYGREGCIARFRAYFYERIERDPEWKAKVLELAGKRMGCHCKRPDRFVACHGDVYVEYLLAYEWLEYIKL